MPLGGSADATAYVASRPATEASYGGFDGLLTSSTRLKATGFQPTTRR